MKQETYDHIEKYIHLLEIDYENGLILNRKSSVVRGYAKVKFKQKIIGVHQIISYLKCREQNIGLVVNHIDGNKLNNKPINLEIVTQQQNAIHAFEIGLRVPYKPKGIEHDNAILNDDDVRKIRKLIKNGMMLKDIASMYKIDPSVISRIRSGDRWTHVV